MASILMTKSWPSSQTLDKWRTKRLL